MFLFYHYRPFIHRDRKNLNEIFRDCSVLKDIYYNVYLIDRYGSFRFNIQPLDLFNEVLHQCVHVLSDVNLEDDIISNYIDNSKYNLKVSDSNSQIGYYCLSIAYAVLSLMKGAPTHVKTFCLLYENIEAKSGLNTLTSFKKFIVSKRKEGYEFECTLRAQPELPSVIKSTEHEVLGFNFEYYTEPMYDYEWWRSATNDFEQEIIVEIISLWNSYQHKLEILDQIEAAFNHTN